MKKIYTFLAATSIVFSASAFELNLAQRLTEHNNRSESITYEAAGTPEAIEAAGEVKSPRLLSARKADSNPSIEGEWDIRIGDYYQDYSTRTELTITYTAYVEGGDQVVFIEETGNYLPIVGFYSANTGLLAFGNELLGEEDDPQYGNLKLYMEAFEFTASGTVNKTITARYNASEGTITFDPDTGIAYVMIATKDGREDQTVLDMFDLRGADRTDTWTLLGTSEWTENLLYPIMTGVENTRPAYLEIYKNETNPGLFKLKDAFKSTYAALRVDATSPSMIIDARDPENVLIGQQPIGLNVRIGVNVTGYLLYFSDSWYYQETDIFFNESGLQYIKMTTDEDGVTTITSPSYGCVLFGPKSQTAYKCPYPSTLKFYADGGDYDAVESIISDGTEGPAEYYSIQGLRVINPQPGQLLIRRQGNKAEKVIF